jgi:hypothetical protein
MFIGCEAVSIRLRKGASLPSWLAARHRQWRLSFRHDISTAYSTFKAIYVPSLNPAVAFTSINATAPICRIVPVAEITRRTGIDPFPALPASLKARLPAMPLPQVRGARFPACR